MYRYLHELLPEIASKETSIITIEDVEGIEKGDYGLYEMYCSDKGCDCRRVFLNVMNIKTMKSIAVIAYGWESKKFYSKWFGSEDDINNPEVNEMCGFSFASMPQSKYAGVMMEIIKDCIEGNKEFKDKTKRHYKAFKQEIDK